MEKAASQSDLLIHLSSLLKLYRRLPLNYSAAVSMRG